MAKATHDAPFKRIYDNPKRRVRAIGNCRTGSLPYGSVDQSGIG